MAKIRRIDGSFILDWRDQNGTRHRDTLGAIGVLPDRDATRILKQKQLELSAGYRQLVTPAAPTLGAFARDYLAWSEAEYPSSFYRVRQIVTGHLLPAFEFRALDMIRPAEAESWKRERLKKVERATVAKELRVLKAILNKAVAWEVLLKNPLAHVKEPRRLHSEPPAFHTVEDLKALYSEATGAHEAIWRLYANTGMRRMEGMHLKRAWVGRDGLKILSSEKERTKSGKWREIPLTDGARDALQQLQGEEGYVLPRMHPASLSRACIKDTRQAGLEGGIHTLRHTYGSHLVMAGVPLRMVQLLMGHSTIRVTEQYAHVTPGRLRDAGRAISL